MKIRIEEPLRLDILAHEAMGSARDGESFGAARNIGGALEALLNANRGFAAAGPFLDAPREVEIPPLPEKPAVPTVNPWE